MSVRIIKDTLTENKAVINFREIQRDFTDVFKTDPHSRVAMHGCRYRCRTPTLRVNVMYVVATDETKWPRSGSILQSMLKAKRFAHCALRKYQGKEPQHKQCL